MATKIRLKRVGRRNRPFYRIVVMDSRKRRDGAAIEQLGWYNPIDIDHSYDLKSDRILHWLGEGAMPTDAAQKLIRRAGLAHKWHLIKQGMSDSDVDKEMKKWALKNEEVQKARKQKQEQKVESKLTEKQKKDIDDETSNDESKLVEDDKAENNKPESSTESDLKSQEEE